jgi:geranylgeranyl diphosphate synthase type II
MTALLLTNLLDSFKIRIEQIIHNYIDTMGEKTVLRDACEYALKNGGKRFRPALVFMVAKALGHGADVSCVALGVEFAHTASLIADDLPCMDNDDMRRDKPSTHKVFGESVALLASYVLISASYGLLAENAKVVKQSGLPHADHGDELCVLMLENISTNLGIHGTTGGQFLDIVPPNLSWQMLFTIIHKKTGTLFEVAFVAGWLFGGGPLEALPTVKKAAKHFGLAFQIADDLGDMEQDIINGRLINVANVLGKEKAIELFHGEIAQFKTALDHLHLQSEELNAIADLLVQRVAVSH